MPSTPTKQQKKKQSPKKGSHKLSTKPKDKQQSQKAGGSDICQKDINQLLMGNPPVSIGGNDDLATMWRKTKTAEAAKDLDTYGKKGWGNYPGTPPKPDCAIL